jgi:GNAT superfamily N-acetyltransferase
VAVCRQTVAANVAAGMDLMYSEAESRRFGMRVFRARLESFHADQLRTAIFGARADLVICRAPAGLLPELAGLQRLGMPVVLADTLVHYSRDLALPPPNPSGSAGVEYVEAGADAGEEVSGLVRRIFTGYLNHYAANPLLEPGSVLEGYVEWATGFLAAAPKRRMWLALRSGKPIALAACQYEADTAEGVLFGVVPEAVGAGVYRNLIRFTLADATARGLRTMGTSTQVHNFAVQKVWASEGFVMRAAEVTFHVNALLSSSHPAAATVEATVEGDGISGLVERHVRRVVDARLPGCELSGARLGWSAAMPLAEGAPCRLHIGFPAARGGFPAVCVQVSNGAGDLVLLRYHDAACRGEGA